MDFKKLEKLWKKNLEQLKAEDQFAKSKGELKNRYISEPFADGFAIYKIVKVYKKTVKIQVVTGIGDDWRIPYFGDSATIDKKYAEKNVSRRDAWKKICKPMGLKNKKENQNALHNSVG